ncbi:MAG: hypothetical protein KGH63_01770 [Candidatus Micrarchaeota archaeon]|nr:hypothetical protein [Candidatus Micrarchaeota archaeon]
MVKLTQKKLARTIDTKRNELLALVAKVDSSFVKKSASNGKMKSLMQNLGSQAVDILGLPAPKGNLGAYLKSVKGGVAGFSDVQIDAAKAGVKKILGIQGAQTVGFKTAKIGPLTDSIEQMPRLETAALEQIAQAKLLAETLSQRSAVEAGGYAERLEELRLQLIGTPDEAQKGLIAGEVAQIHSNIKAQLEGKYQPQNASRFERMTIV